MSARARKPTAPRGRGKAPAASTPAAAPPARPSPPAARPSGQASTAREAAAGGHDNVGGAGPCVGMLELASIAAGFETTDGLRKEAAVRVLQARAVTPGKFLILFTGTVEDVSSALRRGLELGADTLLDSLFIPNIEPTLLALVEGAPAAPGTLDAVGVIETLSVASTIRAADIAAKTASLRLVGLGLAAGIGGKSYVTFTGEVADVGSAVDAGASDAERAGMLVRRVVIPRPHADMTEVLGG